MRSGTHPKPTRRRLAHLWVERQTRNIAFLLDGWHIDAGRWVTLRKQSIQDRIERWARERN